MRSRYGLVPGTILAISSLVAVASLAGEPPSSTFSGMAPQPSSPSSLDYRFDRRISRQVLENYLSRAITVEGSVNGRGDLKDNIRMLKSIGAKYLGPRPLFMGRREEFPF